MPDGHTTGPEKESKGIFVSESGHHLCGLHAFVVDFRLAGHAQTFRICDSRFPVDDSLFRCMLIIQVSQLVVK
jgi:hypothetical protein